MSDDAGACAQCGGYARGRPKSHTRDCPVATGVWPTGRVKLRCADCDDLMDTYTPVASEPVLTVSGDEYQVDLLVCLGCAARRATDIWTGRA